MTATPANLQTLIARFQAVWLDDSKQREAIRLAHQIDAMKERLYGPAMVG